MVVSLEAGGFGCGIQTVELRVAGIFLDFPGQFLDADDASGLANS
jgi:hypothetical protein